MARFLNPGPPGPAGAPGAPGDPGAQGLSGFEWDATRVSPNGYLIGDIVNYLGTYYICIANNDAIVPPTGLGVYWNQYSFVGAEGPQGDPGAQGDPGPPGPEGPPSAEFHPFVIAGM